MLSELTVIEGLFSHQYVENERCPYVKRNERKEPYCGSPSGGHKVEVYALDKICFSPMHSTACRFYKKPET